MAEHEVVPGGTAHTGEHQVDKLEHSAPRKGKFVRLHHRHNWSSILTMNGVPYHFDAYGHQDVPADALGDANYLQASAEFTVTEVPKDG